MVHRTPYLSLRFCNCQHFTFALSFSLHKYVYILCLSKLLRISGRQHACPFTSKYFCVYFLRIRTFSYEINSTFIFNIDKNTIFYSSYLVQSTLIVLLMFFMAVLYDINIMQDIKMSQKCNLNVLVSTLKSKKQVKLILIINCICQYSQNNIIPTCK